ncbi:MAG: hypothetical protein HYZ02_02850 [Candidatus Levybacteria bacterium]|nr:hypothetical protein [Candidatus Levybacteria bacterium]
MSILGSVEQRPNAVLRGLNPRVTELPAYPGHPFVQVDLQPDRKAPIGHLYIPRNKVPTKVLEEIQSGQVEALLLDDPKGPWEIVDVQLRPESGGR